MEYRLVMLVSYFSPSALMVLQSQIKSSSGCVVDIIVVVSVQDNYTFAQPGIQNNVKALEELVSRIDGEIWSSHVVYSI